jgi:predicted RNase H-like HicB family nuclease
LFVILEIEIERESDGRVLAAIPALPGVMSYGATRDEAVARVKVLALRVIADEIEHGERSPESADTTFSIAA